MKMLSRIAKPCGIVGGVWGLLAPVLMFLPIMPRVIVDPATGEQRRETASMVEAGAAGSALPWLSLIALMGLLGILALLLRSSKPHVSSVLIWISALGMLSICIISIFFSIIRISLL